MEQVLKKVEEEIKKLLTNDISTGNVEYLYKLVDIHKDIKNEEFWKEQKNMRYSEYDGYGNYGRENYGENYGYEGYGRRGVPGTGRRYRGEEELDNVYRAYRDYNDSYGNNMKNIEAMSESLKGFVEHLMQEAKTPEEKEMIKRKIQELGRM